MIDDMPKSIFYSVLIVCVTVVIVTILVLTSKEDELKADLLVECLYTNSDSENPLDDCTKNIVPRMLRVKDVRLDGGER